MNDDRERIIEFDAATSIPDDGWLAIDSSTEGTKKIQKSAIIGSGQLDTESQEVIGAINEVNQKAATIDSMTQQQYDDLPSTKLSDNVPRFITDGVPTVDQTLWNKVGTSTLNTTAQNCSDAINELKSNLTELGTAQSKIFKNAQTIVFNLKNAPSGDNVAQALMFNANQGMCAIVRMDSALSVTNILGSMGWTISNSGSTITITPSTRLWGATSVIVDEIN